MKSENKPFKVIATKFLGKNTEGMHTYEITFNQSISHTGRITGIEDGLNSYRENEEKEHEENILQEAEEIKSKRNDRNT